MFDPFFNPRSIAVIGASRRPDKVGHALLANLVKGGFPGRIVPVNPAAEEILGLPCYASLKESKESVDLVIVALRASQTKSAVKEAAHTGAKAVMVVSAGFQETGPEGAALEKEIVTICRDRDIRLLGPNCLGVVNAAAHLHATFAKALPQPGGVSIFSQSGALCAAFIDWAEARGLGIAKVLSIGNKADISEIDCLKALAKDDDTRVILGYLESITDGEGFIRAAEAASANKPVVIHKAGVTEAGRLAVAAHTGGVSGRDLAYGAAFKRAGVIRADTYDDLRDLAITLALQPLPKGDRVAVITNAGGPGVMAADALEKAGLTVARLKGGSRAPLFGKGSGKKDKDGGGTIIDVLGDAGPDRYAKAMKRVIRDDNVDSVIVLLTPQAMTQPWETAQAIAPIVEKEKSGKPVLFTLMGGYGMMPDFAKITELGLPPFAAPEPAARVLAAMRGYAAWKDRPPRIVTHFPVNKRRAERVLTRHVRTQRREIAEISAKEILKAYGFPVPEGRLATTEEEALTAAHEIGYPVALKIASPDIVHKRTVGGVTHNIPHDTAVRDVFELMTHRVEKRRPQAQIDGVYVEKMPPPQGRHVAIGMVRDPQFGPMLMFGLGGLGGVGGMGGGGSRVEVMEDVSFHVAPITADEALHMLRGTESYRLLRESADEGEADLEAVAECLQRLSQLATDFPQITELMINPLIAGPAGTPPLATDARITLAPPPEGA